MKSAFGIDHGEIYKKITLMAQDLARATQRRAKLRFKPKPERLAHHQQMGARARTEDFRAKREGALGIDIHSRPRGRAGRRAWDQGWGSVKE